MAPASRLVVFVFMFAWGSIGADSGKKEECVASVADNGMMQMQLAPTSTVTHRTGAPAKCADILTYQAVFSSTSKGVDLSAYFGQAFWIGCFGDGCTASSFYCTDSSTSLHFGTTTPTSAMRSCVGVDQLSSCNTVGGCCSRQGNGICNSPDKPQDAQAICQALGYASGTLTAVSSNSCPEAHWDAGSGQWTSDYQSTQGYGRVFTCNGLAPTSSPTDSPTVSPTSSPTGSPTGSPTQAPTSSPTDSPTVSPTSSPTGSPTGSPTQAVILGQGGGLSDPVRPPNTVKAIGDPHMTNIYGQHFDIVQPGSHVLLQIPKRAARASSKLRVEADVQEIGQHCADMYIKTLNITGVWVNSKRKGGLFYRAGKAGTSWRSFGPIKIKVAPGRTRDGVRYLNLFLKDISRAGYPVGGLLGEDDHTAAATPQRSCKKFMSLLSLSNEIRQAAGMSNEGNRVDDGTEKVSEADGSFDKEQVIDDGTEADLQVGYFPAEKAEKSE